MSYKLIDPVIDGWAKKNGISIQKDYKDEEVRTTNIFGLGEKNFQVWIDSPDESNSVGVHVWDYKKLREDFIASTDELERVLDKTLEVIDKWVGE